MWRYFGLECKCDIIILWLKKYVKENISWSKKKRLLVRLKLELGLRLGPPHLWNIRHIGVSSGLYYFYICFIISRELQFKGDDPFFELQSKLSNCSEREILKSKLPSKISEGFKGVENSFSGILCLQSILLLN